jgi:endonuclease/exonuclease/phosphatase family metal-dependent hydrolase
MRLASYNILDGGEGRADPLAEVLLAQRPDVVALVEADDAAVLERIAGRLKMDFIHAPGNSHASAILSRWPIRSSINHALLNPVFSKSLLEASIIEPNGTTWTVGAVHLQAGATEADENKREEEVAQLLRIFEPHREKHLPHLLVGDFNSNASYQQIDPVQCKPRTRQEWKENGGKIPRRVVDKIINEGYRDALHESDPTSNVGTFSTQFPGQRVDFIFAFGPVRIAAAWVEQDRLAKYASDHFPIAAEIAIAGSH